MELKTTPAHRHFAMSRPNSSSSNDVLFCADLAMDVEMLLAENQRLREALKLISEDECVL